MKNTNTPDGNSHPAIDLSNIVAALEPDQLISAKTNYPVPRRELTDGEIILFWMLRLYLVFMLAVVIYQVATTVR